MEIQVRFSPTELSSSSPQVMALIGGIGIVLNRFGLKISDARYYPEEENQVILVSTETTYPDSLFNQPGMSFLKEALQNVGRPGL